jgi:hypothetical protein
MSSNNHVRGVGSGAVVALGLASVAIGLLELGRVAGWVGVTPLQPPFFDMHVINDYAACASKGVDAYAPHACNGDNFNIPPTWLWLSFLGIDGSDSFWLSGVMIAATSIVLVLLFRGRSWYYGLIALTAIISPSVMMGVERGNLDLLVLALVGLAALAYHETRTGRVLGSVAILCLGITLKLVPMFCVSLVARFSRRMLNWHVCRRNSFPVRGRNLLRDVFAGHEFYLSPDVSAALPATASGLADPKARTRQGSRNR